MRSQWNGDPPTGKSVSVSCRACVRAGEAKLRVNLVLLGRRKTESPWTVRRWPAVSRCPGQVSTGDRAAGFDRAVSRCPGRPDLTGRCPGVFRQRRSNVR